MTSDRHISTVGPWRFFRGAVVGAFAIAFASGGHHLAGEALPPFELWLTMSVLALAVSASASRWQWRVSGLTGAMLLAQLVFHVAFAAYAGSAGQHSLEHPLSGPMTHRATVGSGLPDGRMLALHLVAALVVAAVLRFGEDVLRSTLDALALRLARTLRGALAGVPEVKDLFGATADLVQVSGGPTRSCWSRGPPQ